MKDCWLGYFSIDIHGMTLSHGTRSKSLSSVAMVFIPWRLHVSAIMESASIRPCFSMILITSCDSDVIGKVINSLSTGSTSSLTS